MTRRIVYVAYGKRATSESIKSIETLRCSNKTNVSIISNEFIPGYDVIKFDNPGYGARLAKLSIDTLTKDDTICYLDADTRIYGDLTPAFEIIEDGYDLAIAPSANQEYNVFSHIGIEERELTLAEIGYHPLQLQAGVMFFSRERCRELFSEWRRQWQRFGEQDQAALVRAINKNPVRIWILGKCWNSDNGAVVSHLFGRAR